MSCNTITIFSSKGGVGKTFISVNMAIALATTGNKVLVLDFDFQAGQDMARMLNISPRSSVADLSEMFSVGEEGFIQKNVAIHNCGLHFLPVVRGTQQAPTITPEVITQFFKLAQQHYDFIIVDGGKMFHENLITVLDYSNLIFLVATPDILAVYQIKWCLDVLQKLQYPSKMVKLILNRSESRGSVAWQEVRTALTCEIFAHIPSDGKEVGISLNRGVPIVLDNPRSPVSDAFIKLARALKRPELFIQTTDVKRERSTEGAQESNKFWEKFGIARHNIASDGGYEAVEDEIISLKKKIHEKLVQRLNVEGITIDNLSDPVALGKVKKKSEEIVGNILVEEAGARITSHEERIRLVNDIINEALGLGPLEDFLADPDVTDIMANNRKEIYVEKSGKLILTNKSFISDDKMRSIIDRIIAPLGRRIDESTPMVDARLPDGSRINAIIPPLSLNGPMITIRKFAQDRLTVVDMLEKMHSMSKEMADFLRVCVLGRRNIIVSGGTGAGKTTLLNMISEFIPDGERIITIEDAAELRLKKSHWARLESRPKNVEGKGEVTIRDLFTNSLRMRPDRIVIGECRGAEVLDMLQAMNTGHDGSMTTLHANSTRDVVTRMHSMILLAGIELPVRAINEMLSSAIDVVVHINRFSDGTRKITGISETAGLDHEFMLQLEDVFEFKQTGIDPDGKILGSYKATGYLPSFYDEFISRALPIKKEWFENK